MHADDVVMERQLVALVASDVCRQTLPSAVPMSDDSLADADTGSVMSIAMCMSRLMTWPGTSRLSVDWLRMSESHIAGGIGMVSVEYSRLALEPPEHGCVA